MVDWVNILGIHINKVNMKDAMAIVRGYILNGDHCHMVVTPNSEMVVRAQDDPELAMILNNANLSVPDGAGVVLASRLFKNSFQERVAGFDLMKNIFSEANRQGYRIYLLGGRPGIVDKARKNLIQEYPYLKICGAHHGYLDKDLQERVIEEINMLKPDLLFVGMGVPLQEKFIYKNMNRLQVKVAMTVGGAFDVLAGQVKRAPRWMQNAHLEWLFRLLQEPSRLGRFFALPRFVYLVLIKYLKMFFRGAKI